VTMLHEAIEPLWAELRGYAQRLVADLAPDEMVSQPVAGVVMNHPAWVLSHLGAYAPVIEGLLVGEPVEDPLDHPFGRKSAPVAEVSAYAPRDELIDAFIHGYDRIVDALAMLPPERLTEPTPIDRWVGRFPTLGHLPVQFVIKHNAHHLGQVSAWRRAGGRRPV